MFQKIHNRLGAHREPWVVSLQTLTHMCETYFQEHKLYTKMQKEMSALLLASFKQSKYHLQLFSEWPKPGLFL